VVENYRSEANRRQENQGEEEGKGALPCSGIKGRKPKKRGKKRLSSLEPVVPERKIFGGEKRGGESQTEKRRPMGPTGLFDTLRRKKTKNKTRERPPGRAPGRPYQALAERKGGSRGKKARPRV